MHARILIRNYTVAISNKNNNIRRHFDEEQTGG